MHSSSIAETLAGAPTDLALQLSTTREAGYGYYTPYIGVVRDVARIFGAFNNPQFRYLPTLSLRRGNKVSRSEEHTSELQSLMRISYAVFCLKKKTNQNTKHTANTQQQV